jgi:sugar transferase EpsL
MKYSWLLKLIVALVVFSTAAAWMAVARREVEYLPLVGNRRTTKAYDPVKRWLDLTLSALALTIAGPIMLALAVLIRLKIGSPVLFRQQRPGLYGEPFTILKFRTMTDKRDAQGNLLPDAERMTKLGEFLRRSSLDELPELINVLRGDMSLVGPRPLFMQYLEYYSTRQARRHDVRPGITGLAQIKGRNGIAWDEKFRHDLYYVDHRSLWLDAKILFLTVWKVVRQEGISQEGFATVEYFTGGDPEIEMELEYA